MDNVKHAFNELYPSICHTKLVLPEYCRIVQHRFCWTILNNFFKDFNNKWIINMSIGYALCCCCCCCFLMSAVILRMYILTYTHLHTNNIRQNIDLRILNKCNTFLFSYVCQFKVFLSFFFNVYWTILFTSNSYKPGL